MSVSKKIKWGIIGPGKISGKFVKDLLLVDEAEVVAVASRSLERSKTFAQAYKIENAYGNYETLFQDPNVDIIYIGTPHNTHKGYAINAMNAGKHVLCEKPLAVNKVDVQEMVDCARANKVFMMEALWTRFNPSIKEILGLIEQNKIGEVNYLNADFCFYKEAAPESRMYNMELAGGSLLDVGIYPVFLAYLIFGKPNEILATGRFHKTGADLQTAIILKYENGIANLSSGFASKSDMVAKIHGAKGRIMINEPWHHSRAYKIINDGVEENVERPLKGLGFTYEIEECHKCLNNGQLESKLWSHQNSLDLIAICDEIRAQIGLKYPFED